MWRPKNWPDFSIVYDECRHDWQRITDLSSEERLLVELGADAILKALREQPDAVQCRTDSTGVSGRQTLMVFIPDEGEIGYVET